MGRYADVLWNVLGSIASHHFGQQGIFGGSLNVPHALAVDSKGNIYVGENFDGRRFQRFVYKGMGAPTGKTLPPPRP
jgi:hypothetical protein